MTNDPVAELLDTVGIALPTNHAIMVALRALVQENAPEADEMIKYGGLHYVRTKPFCGIYSHAKHVSLEFSRGVEFDDGLLEGDGQYRRHLKFTDPSALDAERVGSISRPPISGPSRAASGKTRSAWFRPCPPRARR